MIQITGKTKIVGVIGDPVEHSRSPQMHNAAFEELGLNYVYVPFHIPPDALPAAIEGFKAINVVGLNVTIPHKQAVIPFLDEVSRDVELIGAVNTLTFQKGRIKGDNTDGLGFLEGMRETGFELTQGESALVIGAGGSARAVIVALTSIGLETIFVANRTTSKAIKLAEDLSDTIGTSIHGIGLDDAQLADIVDRVALVVNTASVGMDISRPPLIHTEWLRPQTAVYDIVYTPPETRLLLEAAERGCHTIQGLGMLVHQGAIAFEKWTKTAPPVKTMKQVLQQSLH